MTAGGKPVIITGDDFGWNSPINHAIARSHREGILGSASLMMTGGAVPEAVEIARSMPQMKVGLHLALSRSPALLPHRETPTITDAQGRLGHDLARTGLLYFFSPRARREVEREIRAQFEAYALTGLALDHANVHNHMHLHPTVMGLILDVGRDFGLRAVRLPYEPLIPALRHARQGGLPLVLRWLLLLPWTTVLKRRLRARRIFCNDYLFGIVHTGRISRDTLARMMRTLPASGLSEIHLHPGMGRSHNDPETEALTDSAIRKLFAALNLRLTSYGEQTGEPNAHAFPGTQRDCAKVFDGLRE